MIRDHIGLLALAQHEDGVGVPQAFTIYDQNAGTERCEQSAAALPHRLPALDDKIVTTDTLHCQKAATRAIGENGGDNLLKIRSNQPTLHSQAEACNTQPHTPFFLTDPGHGRLSARRVHAFGIETLNVDLTLRAPWPSCPAPTRSHARQPPPTKCAPTCPVPSPTPPHPHSSDDVHARTAKPLGAASSTRDVSSTAP